MVYFAFFQRAPAAKTIKIS